MRRASFVTCLFACLIPFTPTPSRADVCADFEDLDPGTNLYWNGVDHSGGFRSQAVFFTNTYSWVWGGFAYSRVNDTNTPGYQNQYAVISGTGVGGTGIYAVAYDNGEGEYGPGEVRVTLPVAAGVKGCFLNNTTYTVRDLQNGSDFSKRFGGVTGNDPDWLKVIVTGFDAAGQATGTTEFYLADYRFADNAQDYIVQAWTWLDLSGLGSAVKSLKFAIDSSDKAYGFINTPTYFALDNLTTDETYAPGVGMPGTTAIDMDTNALIAWATGWTNYQPGALCSSDYQTPERATGMADGHSFGIVCLGDGGRITMTFNTPVKDGPGADFAVFENAIEYYLELAYVEVSSDGTHFVRFPNRSLTPRPATGEITSVNGLRPENLKGLGCKYIQGYGEPYDLGDLAGVSPDLDLQSVRFVRLIDIIGDGSSKDSVGHGIYDPYPYIQGTDPGFPASAGFDLDAIGVLSNATEEVGVSATIAQGAERGTRKAQFTVTRKSWSTASNLVVRLAFSGTASNGVDYASLPPSVTLPAGAREAAITILPLIDNLNEGDETVTVTLLSDPAYLVGPAASATAHILDRFPVTVDSWRAQSMQVDFEDLDLGTNLYWNGSDHSGGFRSQAVFFTNTYSWVWGGFAYSRVNDTNTPGYQNQYAVISGTGVGGTGIYAVAYDNGEGEYGPGEVRVTLPVAAGIKGCFLNNTTYTVRDLQNGSDFSKRFGGVTGNDPDWLKVIVTGFDAAGQATGTTEFYLADYRFADNAQDYIVQAWTWLDLSGLGSAVKSLKFAIDSSDKAYGFINTPTYFALDNLELNPDGAAAGDAGDWNGDGTPNLMAYALGHAMGAAIAVSGGLNTTPQAAAPGYFEVEFQRRHGMTDATLRPLFATTLGGGGTWIGGPGHVEENITATAGDIDTVRARLLDSATNAIGFVKLEAFR